MNSTSRTTLMSSVKMDWCTPKVLADRIFEFFGGIDLDPCGNAHSPVRAKQIWTAEGLDLPWAGNVYVNPPYGREIGPWIQKCRKESRNDGIQIVALVPSRTDTKWFHDAHFDAVCLLRGRLTFVDAPAPAPFPSAILYWGASPSVFNQTFGKLGMTLVI